MALKQLEERYQAIQRNGDPEDIRGFVIGEFMARRGEGLKELVDFAMTFPPTSIVRKTLSKCYLHDETVQKLSYSKVTPLELRRYSYRAYRDACYGGEGAIGGFWTQSFAGDAAEVYGDFVGLTDMAESLGYLGIEELEAIASVGQILKYSAGMRMARARNMGVS